VLYLTPYKNKQYLDSLNTSKTLKKKFGSLAYLAHFNETRL